MSFRRFSSDIDATISRSIVLRNAPCATAATPPITTNSTPASRSLGISCRKVAIVLRPGCSHRLTQFQEGLELLHPLCRGQGKVRLDLPEVYRARLVQRRVIGELDPVF